MKTRINLGMMLVLGALSARATMYTETFDSGSSVGSIPEDNPVGITFSGTVSDVPAGVDVGSLTVMLNVSGGYNGNLFAYLLAPNGTAVTLLNQPGTTPENPFGAAGSGFNVTLSDGSPSIQTASETPGRILAGTFGAAGTLGNMGGSAADGKWELFFADEVSGGGTSTLTSWSLDIEAVPEPVNVALGIFAGLGVFWWRLGIYWTRATAKKCSAGGNRLTRN
jgi:subtilisin-like proprotein convertase family protein